ncbi:MAG: hypothetical protein DRH97_00260 [Chloroflexi bacterium]|nr:MAG: hypothetical protein DRH97_00260 [Chloroflexota bacterium]
MAVLNLSKEEIDSKGSINDKKKSTIENQMVTRLNRFWTQLGNDWAAVFAATGDSVDVENYRAELEGILRETYRKTIQWFRNDFKRSLEQSLDDAETEEDRTHYELMLELRAKIEPALILWISRYLKDMPPKQATFILNTTSDIINKRVNATIIAGLEAEEGLLSNQDIAKRTRKPLIDENRNRSAQIGEHEVGTAAGDAQLSEGGAFENELSATPLAAVLFLEKIWHNVGDGKVRPAHVIAAGQRRRLKQPFMVMGQLLMKPRDYSLGATAANVAGCRCFLSIQ